MTVSTEDDLTQYNGDGDKGPFSIGFPILANDQIKVTRTSSAGVDTELTLNAGSDGYTVNSNLDEVTTTENVESGETLTIERDMDLTQESDYQANSVFPAGVNEEALDKLTMICQQINNATGRALKFKSTLSSSLAGILTEAPEDGYGLIWDGTGGNLQQA